MAQTQILLRNCSVVCPECDSAFSTPCLMDLPEVTGNDIVEADLHRVLPPFFRGALIAVCPFCNYADWTVKFTRSIINPDLLVPAKSMDDTKKFALAVKVAREKKLDPLDIAFIAVNGLYSARENGEPDNLWLELAAFEHSKGMEIDHLVPLSGQDHLMMAELWRQMGQFEKALAEYDLASNDDFVPRELVRQQKERAHEFDSSPTVLPLYMVRHIFLGADLEPEETVIVSKQKKTSVPKTTGAQSVAGADALQKQGGYFNNEPPGERRILSARPRQAEPPHELPAPAHAPNSQHTAASVSMQPGNIAAASLDAVQQTLVAAQTSSTQSAAQAGTQQVLVPPTAMTQAPATPHMMPQHIGGAVNQFAGQVPVQSVVAPAQPQHQSLAVPQSAAAYAASAHGSPAHGSPAHGGPAQPPMPAPQAPVQAAQSPMPMIDQAQMAQYLQQAVAAQLLQMMQPAATGPVQMVPVQAADGTTTLVPVPLMPMPGHMWPIMPLLAPVPAQAAQSQATQPQSAHAQSAHPQAAHPQSAQPNLAQPVSHQVLQHTPAPAVPVAHTPLIPPGYQANGAPAAASNSQASPSHAHAASSSASAYANSASGASSSVGAGNSASVHISPVSSPSSNPNQLAPVQLTSHSAIRPELGGAPLLGHDIQLPRTASGSSSSRQITVPAGSQLIKRNGRVLEVAHYHKLDLDSAHLQSDSEWVFDAPVAPAELETNPFPTIRITDQQTYKRQITPASRQTAQQATDSEQENVYSDAVAQIESFLSMTRKPTYRSWVRGFRQS